MTLPIIPNGFCAALSKNLPDRAEAVVGNEAQFLANIDASSTQICIKCRIFGFE
jgi:hypothetical protein